MTHKIPYRILIILSALAMILGACGNSIDTSAAIGTAVALTVTAQNVQPSTATPTDIPPTATVPSVITFPTPTKGFTILPTQTASSAAVGDAACAKANLISENVPDGTIMKPGATFTKTWTIKNSSSCYWNTNYKIVYYDGDIMGGAYVYNLPLAVGPEGTTDISLVLTAPATTGTSTGYWKLQTPNGIIFGVGQYSEPFFVKIAVNSADKPVTGITKVTYDLIRDPAGGCATTVRYTVVANVTANGPIKIKYTWLQSDGNNSNKGTLTFTGAGTQQASNQWNFHLGSTPGTKWMEFTITDPSASSYGRQTFDYLCGNTP